ncbi:Ribokinase-like protein [Ceraceosorus guamensis]|uniref:ATP-dependent (S)-NAD(P)H-hydrate dehydratase n=1 Tax=Ceraceosorus guamensis TaxID=1522189 RepID=A0A316VWB9_9BASI|nr:Ribokinase-like protein [Ceraceosorus guamensis]PWN40611.1 Ribokinase-like protein [Ceraceosorus guamensis]
MSSHSSRQAAIDPCALSDLRNLIPPLTSEAHKGQAGRVGIVGGSADYSGAPFFAAMTSMRLGCDMSFNICSPDAGHVIKTYSPDLIVMTLLGQEKNDEQLKDVLRPILGRLHALVVGPGLGRDKHMQTAGRIAIQLAKSQQLPIVVDADGLWLLSNEPNLLMGYNNAILTPNVVEFGRLCDALNVDRSNPDTDDAVVALSKQFGCTILQKGKVDRISNGKQVLHVDAPGSLKRCGGQGDILSGSLGTFIAWAQVSPYKDRIEAERRPLLAAFGAALIARASSRKAFERKKRSMLAHDAIDEVGNAYEE